MAYMNQEKKKALLPWIKSVLNKYWVKGTVWVDNYSTLVVKLRSGKIDFQKAYTGENFNYQCNVYRVDKNYDWEARECLKELLQAMNEWNHDNSDSMTDYFDVGRYKEISIGEYNKPYILQ